VRSGLSTGEGLIADLQGEVQNIDADRRRLIQEPEFAAVLTVCERQGNKLSMTLRDAWDGRELRTMTRNAPLNVSDPHVSVVAHVTRDELVDRLHSQDAANGFANRFLWICVRRARTLPFGGNLTDEALAPIAEKIVRAVGFSRQIDRPMTFGETARKRWCQVYADLSRGRPGFLGGLLARGEAHVVRLAGVYALLDCTPTIECEHLDAALELWAYSERSARYILGAKLGDADADKIYTYLRNMHAATKSEISDIFGRNFDAARIDAALQKLLNAGSIVQERDSTGGRPRQTFKLVTANADASS